MKKIKNYLQDNGYKTAEGNTKWHLSTIERILRRRTYIGEYEYMQSVTIDPLTHERVSQLDKSMRVVAKGNFPVIIEPEVWYKVQEIIDSRVNRIITNDGKIITKRGIPSNKDIYCRKMRCGCGRRFKKDLGRKDGIATYRCYQLVDDGSQTKRLERSQLLQDNCCINGIIDWKLNFFIKKVFDYLTYNTDTIQEYLLSVLNKVYVPDNLIVSSEEDKLKLEMDIEKLEKKKEKLVDALTDDLISKDMFKVKKQEIDKEISEKQVVIQKIEKRESRVKEKEETLGEVKEFVSKSLSFGGTNEEFIPEKFVDVFVNSIKACANNVFEYNIRVNPNAEVQSPLVVPDEDFIPSIHSATKKLDNSSCVLLAEFEVDYDMEKEYANKLKRKVKRVHWETPAKIKIYVNL